MLQARAVLEAVLPRPPFGFSLILKHFFCIRLSNLRESSFRAGGSGVSMMFLSASIGESASAGDSNRLLVSFLKSKAGVSGDCLFQIASLLSSDDLVVSTLSSVPISFSSFFSSLGGLSG